MPLTDEQRERKKRLERELSELRAEDEPLTIAEIREMSQEEVEEH